MNFGRFRLVYSQYLNMFVPVSEATKSRGQKSSGKRMRSRHALTSALIAVAYSCNAVSASLAPNTLPVVTPTTLPKPAIPADAANIARTGAATIKYTTSSEMQINQTTNDAMINWTSFDIGSKASVNFNHLNSTSRTLNKISDSNASQIFGKLTANGQIYLINQNGILFGKDATVNVNSLIASSLDISDSVFEKGFSSITNGDPVFSGNSGFVQVDAGATITSASGGKIMMFAPNILNNGLINTPDGQTLLAAGQKVYLANSDKDSYLRGLLVEVDSGGTTENLGTIIAERGNVTLAGIAVNQNGRVKATTSVNLNGSVKLQARSDVTAFALSSPDAWRKATVGGQVNLGENSVTEVLPDLADASAVLDTVNVKKSVIDISGKTVHFQKNAWLVAPSGNVSIYAGLDPSLSTLEGDFATYAPANASRIYFESGSGIDVSGVGSGSTAPDRVGEKAAQVSVASNVVLAELLSTQLADSPLQRDGILKKSKVYVDSRLTGVNGEAGTSVANVSGYVAGITHNISERLATGGRVIVQSEGDIIMAPTATINVSGGKVDYTGGTVTKTRLLASNGQAYDIANASKDLKYTAIQNVSYQEQGYTSGKDAGSVLFSAPAMVLEGKLKGDIVAGARQRTLAALPKAATLQIGQNKDVSGIVLTNTSVLHSDIVFDGLDHVSSVPSFYDPITKQLTPLTDEQKQTLHLGSDFAPSSFGNLLYYADGQITVKEGVDISTAPGGSIVLNGGGVDIQGNLTSHSGNITAVAKRKPAYIGEVDATKFANNITRNVELGAHAKLDVSGVWVNDKQKVAATEILALNGGKVSLTASGENGAGGGDVVLKSGSDINASGGAWINASKKLTSGKGGDITLNAGGGFDDSQAHTGKLIMDGTLHADSLATGGSLSVTSGSVTIGTKALGTNGETVIDPNFFRKGGFTSYTVNGYEGLTVAKNTKISPLALTRVLDSSFGVQDSGTDITQFSHLAELPASNAAITRKATSLSLNATTETSGKLLLDSGSTIVTDPGASVNLAAVRQLTVLGSVVAPAGKISMTLGKEPSSTEIVHYLNNQTLWLGKGSLLDVSGVADYYTNANGFRVGSVKDAGSITLDALKGTIVAESGSVVNLDGTRAQIDVKSGISYVAKEVASKGGDLSIAALEGVLWDATMSAKGGNASVAAGSYLLDLHQTNPSVNGGFSGDQYPIVPLEIVLKETGDFVPADLVVGGAIDSVNTGKAYVAADKIKKAGFDSVSLVSPNSIRIAENTTLTTRGAVKLDTANLVVDNNSHAVIKSSYVAIGNSKEELQGSAFVNSPQSGKGTFDVVADNIELLGNQSLSGVNNTTLTSNGDIQLKGVLPANKSLLHPKGGLKTTGELTLNAATIYPSTYSEYTLSSLGTADKESKISFHHQGIDSGVPFSVLGTLNVVADNITQDGVLRAPLGVINLNAANKLTLADGSLTSVSAEGKTFPFGSTLNGKTWTFDEGDRQATITSISDKQVSLNGKFVTTENGSKVDISGGGDLSAIEFITGTGGSGDVLAASGVFAIMPSLKAGYMAGNSESYSNSTLKAGDSIYLSGGNGLPAGNYVLLPAHYALLPGAYSVKAVAGTQDFSAAQNTKNNDGSMIVSGYRTQFGGVSADSRSSGFLVASGDIARTQSEYTSTLASKFFNADSTTKGFRLPTDAGRVAISALKNLVFDGSIIGKHSADSRGSEVDISSDKIAISGDGKPAGGDYLTLSTAKLNAMGAESLFIGGKRTSVAAGTELNVTASNVKLIGGAELTGQEITLAATDTVSMERDTSVTATGTATKNSGALIIGNELTKGSGDGALLRVSTGGQSDFVRKNVSQTAGTLDIKSGAKVSAVSVIADATKSNSIAGEIALAKDGAIRLGAQKISFGKTTDSVTGLLLDNSKLTALGDPANIQLKSYSTIDFYGAVEVGKASLKSLSLESAGLAGFNNSKKTVTLTADTVKFSNPDGAKFTPTVGSGTLTVNAGKQIGLGDGTVGVGGFSAVNFNADQVIGEGKGTFNVAGDLNINAGRITAAGLSDQTIKASGNLVTRKHDAVVALSKAPLGGKLTLEADTIKHGGIIDTPSGIVTLKAEGSVGKDSLVLLSGSQINVKGSAQLLGTTAVLADAGKINLQTVKGNLVMESGAAVDVSSTGGAGAGKVAINTAGTATIAGTLNGLAAVANGVTLPKQGSFELMAGNVADFKILNTELERGHFNESRNIHVAQGDLNIDEGDTVTAHNVTLTTDDGDMKVAGTINATGEKGGIVNLNAGQKTNDGKGDEKGNITLAEKAKIDAYAKYSATEVAGSKGDGGKVTLNTVIDSDISPTKGSTITADKGSQIDVSGKGLGTDGKVVLRAPRLGITEKAPAGDDIAITSFDSTVIGDKASIVAEGVKVYKNESGKVDIDLDTIFVDKILADNTNFLANSSVSTSNLSNLSSKFGSRFKVASGDEVRSTGNIKVTDDIDLHQSALGTLTLRAMRDVNVNGSISAGFTTADTSGELTDGGGWTYRIAAGADLNSAEMQATNNQGLGNFTLADGKLIRTGTGDIEIATGGNFKLDSITSAIYSAGEQDFTDYETSFGKFVTPSVAGVLATYTLNGGDITLNSKGSIVGVSSDTNNVYQLPGDWLYRSVKAFNKRGNLSNSTSWWASHSTFAENIGALAGGDVSIAAGGDISNLSAIVATNGRVFGSSASTGSGTLVVNGGGDLMVQAGGNITGGLYMVDKGVANIHSDGALLADSNSINTAFALGDGSLNVATRGQLDVMAVFNPTLIKQVFGAKPVYFSTYTADSAVKLTSLASGVTITNQVATLSNDLYDQSAGSELLQLLPATLKVGALGGDFTLFGNIAMLPAAKGDLQLAASDSIIFKNDAILAMSDVDPANLPSVLTPVTNTGILEKLLLVQEGVDYHATTPVHQDDKQPVVLYAGKDIVGTKNDISLFLPKKATIYAENDIRNFSVSGQNLSDSDVSSITAGNDLIFTSIFDANNNFISNFNQIDWSGPGYLDITAGRNVNLNNAYGIVTSGNLRNPNLPETGATINVLAGALNADDDKLIAKYIDPKVNTSYVSKLTEFVKKMTGNSLMTDAEAWGSFQAFDASVKHQFAQTVFFNELKQAGIDHNDPTSSGYKSYKRGYDAIATYFPSSNYEGSLDIAFSQIKTFRGGAINLMLPGGDAIIGLPKIPASLIAAKDDPNTTYEDSASLLGLVTVGGGEINIFAKNNINVAQSREFTLAGGDLLNWSSLGDIDAGKGAKTATSAPPPLVRTDTKGNTIIDLSGVVSGSGIGTLQTLPNVPKADTYLIAPTGTVDAGDAGVRSSGNLLVAANRVKNNDNFAVGGTSSGVPAVGATSISFNAPASADSNSANKQGDQLGADDKLGKNTKLAALPSVINVEVISLGDDAAPATKSDASPKSESENKKDQNGKNKKD